MNLTKTVIDSAKYDGDGKSRNVIWDDQIKGLGLRIYPSGRKAFVLSYRSQGRKHLMVLGTYGSVTLQQARKSAIKKVNDLNSGLNPVEEKKKASTGETMSALCNEFLERHAKIRKKSWRDDEQRIRDFIIPALGSKLVKHIKREEISKFHSDLGKNVRRGKRTVYLANRVLALLSSIFGKAKEWGFVGDDFANPATGIEKFDEESREEWLKPEDAPRVFLALKQETNIYGAFAILLYLLTGARKNELLKLKWSDVDFVRLSICLRKTKNGKNHYLPITPQIAKVLNQIPKQKGNPFVFPGKAEGRHLVNIRKVWLRVREASEIEGVRIHDLRHTVASWLAQANQSLQLIGSVLNHSNVRTTQRYAHLGLNPAKAALESHGEQVMNLYDSENATVEK